MRILFPSIVVVFLACICISCKDTGNPSLLGCCDEASISGSFGNAQIFVPNIFTPNDDAVNDHIFVFGDSIQRIISIEIRRRDGEIVYQDQDVLFFYSEATWDGKIDGAVQKGLYTVALEVEAKDGTVGMFEGKVCNYPCYFLDEDELIFDTGCELASEYDVHPTHEPPGCFK